MTALSFYLCYGYLRSQPITVFFQNHPHQPSPFSLVIFRSPSPYHFSHSSAILCTTWLLDYFPSFISFAMPDQCAPAYRKMLALFGKYPPLVFEKVSLLLSHFAIFHFCRRSAAVCCHLALSPMSTLSAAYSAVSSVLSPDVHVVFKVIPCRLQMWV